MSTRTRDVYDLCEELSRDELVALYHRLRDMEDEAIVDGLVISAWGRTPGRPLDAAAAIREHLQATCTISPEAAQRIADSVMTGGIGGVQVFRLDGSGGTWYSAHSRPEVGPDAIMIRCPYRGPVTAAWVQQLVADGEVLQ